MLSPDLLVDMIRDSTIACTSGRAFAKAFKGGLLSRVTSARSGNDRTAFEYEFAPGGT